MSDFVRKIAAGLMLMSASWTLRAQPGWTEMMPQGSLAGWESVGDGLWHALADGIIVGQRNRRTAQEQAWLYSRQDYGQYDLSFEYWLRAGENSGVSIRDVSRGRYSHGPESDNKRRPSAIGYEIQLLGAPSEKYGTGSLYLFQNAKGGFERFHDWNTMVIEVRDGLIRVRLNGELVMEHPGDPARPKRGPIGFQLHDPHTVLLLKNVRIREMAP
jgi:hypothetical protein